MSKPMRRLPVLHFLLPSAIASAFASAVPAQCSPAWRGNGAVCGVSGEIRTTAMWDPDGAGPASALLVAGGQFAVAGDTIVNNVAVFDLQTNRWSGLGSGVDGAVRAVVVLSNGDLVVGGEFANAGGQVAPRLARWDGAAWHSLQMPLLLPWLGSVYALAAAPNGDLYVGGSFSAAAAHLSPNLLRWDGAQWYGVGGGCNGGVSGLCLSPSGDLVAVGQFTIAGGTVANRIASWNGSSWTALGGGVTAAYANAVQCVAALPNGSIVVGGYFGWVDGVAAANVAKWDGAAWQAMGSGLPSWVGNGVHSLCVLPNGDVCAAGYMLQAGGSPDASLLRWNGATWTPFGGAPASGLGSAPNTVTLLPNGDLVVGGQMGLAVGFPGHQIARWNGTAWSPLGVGTAGMVFGALPTDDGGMLAFGSFAAIAGVPARALARWDGTQWTALGAGPSDAVTDAVALRDGRIVTITFNGLAPVAPTNVAQWNGSTWTPLAANWDGRPVLAVALDNDDVVVGGEFTTPASHIARWDGVAWSPMGAGLPGRPDVLLPLQGANLIAAVRIASNAWRVQRWDGAQWHVVGADFDRPVSACVQMPNGDLVVGGAFTHVGASAALRMARWDGAAWSPMGGGFDDPAASTVLVLDLLVQRSGALVAVGTFTSIAGVDPCGGMARWNGSTWSPLGGGANGFVRQAIELPGGDLLVSGSFTHVGGVAANKLARWNGLAWSPVAGGVDDTPGIARMANGEVVATGPFAIAGGVASPGLAWLHSTCPATVSTTAPGCVGTAGPIELTATALPWLGETFLARTIGVPANSFGVLVWGVTATTLPLASLLPQGVPGCSLGVLPDAVELRLPSPTGVIASSLVVPVTTALIGQSLRHQVLPVGLDAAGAIVTWTASNTLQLAFGVF